MTSTPLRIGAVMTLAALALSSCGDNSGAASDDGTVTIVASTNVYGDVARAVAGDLAEVTSIVTSSSQDPHEYEASAQDRLALDGADLVIMNGGGYDSFMETLLDGGNGEAAVLDAVQVSGLAGEEGEEEHSDDEDHAGEEEHSDEEGDDHDHLHIEGFNEHVWYDFHTMEKLAEEISHELGEVDPDNADVYEANYEALAEQIEGLETAAEELRVAAEGKSAAMTEPVPVYLIAEVGLENPTPADFSEAVEEGADVPPRALQEMLDLIDSGDIAVMAYNEQTSDATTDQVRAAAEDAGVPVVDFSETLPEGMTYVEWQQDNLDNLAAALAQP